MNLRFYLDEDVDISLTQALKNRGVDAITTQYAGNTGYSDYEQLMYAKEQHRVIYLVPTVTVGTICGRSASIDHEPGIELFRTGCRIGRGASGWRSDAKHRNEIKLAILYYRAMTRGMQYVEQGIEAYEKQYRERQMHNLIKQARRLGFELTALKE